MKIQELRKRNIYRVGFIDPCAVNQKTLDLMFPEAERKMELQLREQVWSREDILFPYSQR